MEKEETTCSGNILIVDDSATSRTWARVVLERAGYSVREAEDGGEALVMIEAQPPDLILLDVILPGLDGYVVTRRLRQDPRYQAIPIILVTTLGDVNSRVRGLEAGANDFLTKPPDQSELLARVKTMLRLKQSRQELEAEKAKSELLYRISREISAELDLDTLLSRVLLLTIEAFDALSSSIVLLDEGGKPIRKIAQHRDGTVTISGGVWEEIIEKGLAGWVIRNQQATVIPDTRQDARWAVADESHARMLSALAVPLLSAGHVSGALVLTHEEPHYFKPAHLDLMWSIASQAAIVIEKARAFQKEQLRARQLQLVNRAGQRAAAILDPDELLREMAALISQAFDYYHVAFALCKGEELVFEGFACGRRPEPALSPHRLLISEPGIVTWAARHRRSLLVPDVHKDSRYRPVATLPDTVAELAAPMQVGGELLGILDVQSDRPGQLGEEEISLVETLASQVAVALRNAQLFREIQRRLREQEALLETSASISSTLELEEVLRRVAQAMVEAMNVTACSISSWDPQAGTMTRLAGYTLRKARAEESWGEEIGESFSLRDYPAMAHVLEAGEPLVVNVNDPLAAPQEKALLEAYEPGSVLMLPLRARDRVIGLVELYQEVERTYSEREIAFCLALADHAALAIENARLYTQTEAERGKVSAILAGTADAVLVTDNEGRIVLLNPAAERAFACKASLVSGRPLAEAIDNQALCALFQRGADGTPPHTAEIPLANERTLYASIAPVAGVGLVAVMQDITHLKELERMKNDFIATVSHDLRSPLSAIHGYASLLEGTLQGESQDFARRIKIRTQEMAELVNDLLDLGKIEAGVEADRVPCRIDQIVHSTLEATRITAEVKKLTLRGDLGPVERPVLGDAKQLRRALENLISNAIKYTPQGGTVTVRLRQKGERVTVEVEDTGIGIPRDALPRLFEKFYRVPSVRTSETPGTGLGLAIVKAIVEQHGGQVWVESQVDKGSTFGFSLPLSSDRR
jgi:PAS domain S-box-containing protein